MNEGMGEQINKHTNKQANQRMYKQASEGVN